MNPGQRAQAGRLAGGWGSRGTVQDGLSLFLLDDAQVPLYQQCLTLAGPACPSFLLPPSSVSGATSASLLLKGLGILSLEEHENCWGTKITNKIFSQPRKPLHKSRRERKQLYYCISIQTERDAHARRSARILQRQKGVLSFV